MTVVVQPHPSRNGRLVGKLEVDMHMHTTSSHSYLLTYTNSGFVGKLGIDMHMHSIYSQLPLTYTNVRFVGKLRVDMHMHSIYSQLPFDLYQ